MTIVNCPLLDIRLINPRQLDTVLLDRVTIIILSPWYLLINRLKNDLLCLQKNNISLKTVTFSWLHFIVRKGPTSTQRKKLPRKAPSFVTSTANRIVSNDFSCSHFQVLFSSIIHLHQFSQENNGLISYIFRFDCLFIYTWLEYTNLLVWVRL